MPHQPENWLIDNEPWQLVSRGLRKEFAPLLKTQLHSRPNLFGDSSSRISFDRFAGEPALSSLALIQPLKLSWVVNRTPENAHKARALFELGGTHRLPIPHGSTNFARCHWERIRPKPVRQTRPPRSC